MHKKKGVVSMKTIVATGVYVTRKTFDVVVSNIHKDVRQRKRYGDVCAEL